MTTSSQVSRYKPRLEVHVRLDRELREELDRYCARERRTIGPAIVVLVEQALRHHTTESVA